MPDPFIHCGVAPSERPYVSTPRQGVVAALFGPWRPPATMTVAVAERVRFALMRASAGPVPWQVSGKDARGRPRVGHEHLFFLPFTAGPPVGERGLNRVLIWARCGLEDDTRAVLESLAQRGGSVAFGGQPRLRLELLGPAGEVELSAVDRARLVGPARSWRSATPFVPPRYTKRRGGRVVDAAEDQLRALVAANVGAPLVAVEPDLRGANALDFAQQRGRARPGAAAWTMHFASPVSGPIALGSGAHYGLGRFEAVES